MDHIVMRRRASSRVMTRMLRQLYNPLQLGAFLLLLLVSTLSVFGMAGRPPAEGRPAPDFTLPNLQGNSTSLQDYRGKIVLLNFWATWCEPCTKEMPAMQQAYEKLHNKGLVVVAVNELEDVDKVRQHIEDHGHTFPVLLDTDNSVANKYGVYGLPVTVFIDPNGTVREYVKGGTLTEEKIYSVVKRIQEEPSSIMPAES